MKTDMTKGNPMKIILLFSIPVLMGNLFQQFYNMVDTIIVGSIWAQRRLRRLARQAVLCFWYLALQME